MEQITQQSEIQQVQNIDFTTWFNELSYKFSLIDFDEFGNKNTYDQFVEKFQNFTNDVLKTLDTVRNLHFCYRDRIEQITKKINEQKKILKKKMEKELRAEMKKIKKQEESESSESEQEDESEEEIKSVVYNKKNPRGKCNTRKSKK